MVLGLILRIGLDLVREDAFFFETFVGEADFSSRFKRDKELRK